MYFEDFLKRIKEKDYGIVAMNQYEMDGETLFYIVIKKKSGDKAVKGEDKYPEVLHSILDEIQSKVGIQPRMRCGKCGRIKKKEWMSREDESGKLKRGEHGYGICIPCDTKISGD